MKIRNEHYEHFRNEELFEAELGSGLPLRLTYLGLCAISPNGQFPWKLRLLKLTLLPYDEVCFEKILQELIDLGLIRRDGDWGQILPKKRGHE